MKKSLKLLILMTVLFLIPMFVFQSVCEAARQGNIIRVGIEGEPENLAPSDNICLNASGVTRQIYERLLFADMSMAVHPGLATSWKITPDHNIIFHLRKGVKFHDGNPFNAQAVKFSLERIVKEKLKHMKRIPFFKSVEIIDDHTVKVYVKGSPYVALTGLSIYGYIESPAAVKKYNKRDLPLHPDGGTGPFKFVEWVPHQKIVLEANKDYWGGAPKLDGVVIKPVPESQTRMAMVEAGDLDIAVTPPITEIARLKAHPALQVRATKRGSILFFCFNTAKIPFNDYRVRQAFSYAIDRRGIVKTLVFGVFDVGSTYLTPGLLNVKTYDSYPYDPEKAKRMLAELGWKPGKSGFLEKNGKPFKVGLMTPSGRYPMDMQIAEAIQAQLRNIGIDVNVWTAEAAAFVQAALADFENKAKADHGFFLGYHSVGPEAGIALAANMHSGSMAPRGHNLVMFNSGEFDRLVNAAEKELDESKRIPLLKRAQDILNIEIPLLPIYVPKNMLALRKEVKGVQMPNPYNPFIISHEAYIEK